MRAGVTNFQRLAAAEVGAGLIRLKLSLGDKMALTLGRRFTELFRTPASCLDSLTNTQL